MTHFATADDDPAFAREQLARFLPWAEALRAAPPGDCSLHAANSAADARRSPRRGSTSCAAASPRTGSTRSARDPAEHGLAPGARAALLPRRGQADRAPGRAPATAAASSRARRTWIGTVPIGYADGVRRALTNDCDVLVGRAPRAARRHRVDGQHHGRPRARTPPPRGAEVVLIGAQGRPHTRPAPTPRISSTSAYATRWSGLRSIPCPDAPYPHRCRRHARGRRPGRGRLLGRRRFQAVRARRPRRGPGPPRAPPKTSTTTAAPDVNAVNIKLTEIAPTSTGRPRWRCGRATTRSTSPRSRAGSARSATASSSDEPVLDFSSMVNSRRATSRASSGFAFSPDGTKLYVHYSDRPATPASTSTRSPRTARVDAGVAPTGPRPGPAAGEPQRRRARVRTRRAALPRARRRRRRPATRAPGTRRAATASRSARCSARSCGSTRPRAAGSAYTVPADNPFVGHGRRAARRSGPTGCATRGASRSTRRPATSGSATSARTVGGDRLRDPRGAAAGAGANYGWNVFEGTHQFRDGDAPGAVPPVYEYSHDGGNCSVTGGYVYRGTRDPGAARRLPLRRLLRRRAARARRAGRRRSTQERILPGVVAGDLELRPGHRRRAVRGLATRATVYRVDPA